MQRIKFTAPRGAPLVMGIINATPDSFYRESRHVDRGDALATARAMINAGADILDIGGESTRPGADEITASEEKKRVIPVIQAVRAVTDLPISIDTKKAAVAEAALDAGADIINDISALDDDPCMSSLASERKVPVILMHKRGTPKDMQAAPSYVDVIGEIKEELFQAIKIARSAGINPRDIIIDPGIGFAKRHQDNLAILQHIEEMKTWGYPLLVGLSRKSFLGNITGDPVEQRLIPSLAANIWCAIMGADILRVHDVAETVTAIKVIKALQGEGI